ncbi:MAG: hypothetical protein ACLR43_02605 [Faecalibacillus faecis]
MGLIQGVEVTVVKYAPMGILLKLKYMILSLL